MNLKAVATLLALPLLAACAPQVESTIYLTDVHKVLEDGQALATPALLRIPQSGEDDCKKGLADLVAKIATLTPVTGKGKCISKDGDQLAEIETSVQIVTPSSAIDPVNLFTLVAGAADANGNIPLSFHVLKSLDEIAKAIAPDDHTASDFTPTKFILHINNDGRDAATLTPGEVFADGEPHLAGGDPVTIQRRTEVEIRLSDVAASFTEKGNNYVFATLATK